MSNSKTEARIGADLKSVSTIEPLTKLSAAETDEQHSILIEARSSWFDFGFRELWSFRELLYFLTLRDIKLRYKQTLLGAAWAIIQPLFAMILFTLFFGRLAHVPSDNIPYPVFAYAGLLPWTFFANAVTNSGNSLIGSSSLITKIYFPRVIIPAAPVLAALLDFAISFLLLIPLVLYYHVALSWRIVTLPLFVLLLTSLALAVGMWLAALNVRYRDVRYALPFMIQLWLFASPVIYPASLMPLRWRWLLALNPMTGIIEGFRASLFGTAFNQVAIISAVVITLVILSASFFIFKRVEDNFADIV